MPDPISADVQTVVRLGHLCRPGLRACASDETVEVFDGWLEQLSTGRLPSGSPADEVREQLLGIPELDVDDPHDPRFYVSLAVGVISDGVEILEGHPGDEVVDNAESRVLEFYSALGAVLLNGDTALESQAEMEVDATLRSTGTTPVDGSEARLSSVLAARTQG